MKIVVLVKQVPDTQGNRTLTLDDKTVDRSIVAGEINYIDEFAIEEGLRIKEKEGGSVTLLTVGPEPATESIRKALAMGVDNAVHILDDAIRGSDALATANIIAYALGPLEWDLVIAGSETTDARGGVIPALLAEILAVPQLTQARSVSVNGSTASIERVTDSGYQEIEASLPAVVSLVEKANDPRYPTFKGIMAAKKKPIEQKSLADIGLDVSEAGLAGSRTAVLSFSGNPPRKAGKVVKDEGDGGARIAGFLAEERLI